MAFAASDRPRLAARAELRPDRVEGGYFLLYPEKGLRLNPSAVEIVRRCDGQKSLAAIVSELSAAHPEAPAGEIRSQVEAFLEELRRRGLLEAGE